MSLDLDTKRPPLQGEAFLQQAPWCVVRPQQEGYMLYNPRTDELHLLPPAGWYAYRLCDGLHSVGEVAAELAAATDSGAEESLTRVRDFLGALLARGLLVEEGP